jgi:uncharacterized membrane protein YbhN (UPF0104 family)
MRGWFRYLLFASLVFLGVALYKADYLVFPRVHSVPALAGSLACLFAGLIGDALSWRVVLGKSSYPVCVRESIAAVGLTAFAKYIPGKIWAVMGRVAYVAEKRGYPVAQLTTLSITWQFIVVWLGLLFGAVGLLLLRAGWAWGWPVITGWLVLSAVIFSEVAHRIAVPVYKRLFAKHTDFPRLPPRETLVSLPWFIAVWTLLSAGFYLLTASLSPGPVPFATGLGLPLSITLGILAVFSPGGIGVREGAVVGYLTLAGLPVQHATAISIAARLWYLSGEVFMFGIGWAADSALKRARLERKAA